MFAEIDKDMSKLLKKCYESDNIFQTIQDKPSKHVIALLVWWFKKIFFWYYKAKFRIFPYIFPPSLNYYKPRPPPIYEFDFDFQPSYPLVSTLLDFWWLSESVVCIFLSVKG